MERSLTKRDRVHHTLRKEQQKPSTNNFASFHKPAFLQSQFHCKCWKSGNFKSSCLRNVKLSSDISWLRLQLVFLGFYWFKKCLEKFTAITNFKKRGVFLNFWKTFYYASRAVPATARHIFFTTQTYFEVFGKSFCLHIGHKMENKNTNQAFFKLFGVLCQRFRHFLILDWARSIM